MNLITKGVLYYLVGAATHSVVRAIYTAPGFAYALMLIIFVPGFLYAGCTLGEALDGVVIVSGAFFAILGIAMLLAGRLGVGLAIISATIVVREVYVEFRTAAPDIVALALHSILWFFWPVSPSLPS
jgi:hypothetical protein